MDIGVIIVIVVVALILLALFAFVGRKGRERKLETRRHEAREIGREAEVHRAEADRTRAEADAQAAEARRQEALARERARRPRSSTATPATATSRPRAAIRTWTRRRRPREFDRGTPDGARGPPGTGSSDERVGTTAHPTSERERHSSARGGRRARRGVPGAAPVDRRTPPARAKRPAGSAGLLYSCLRRSASSRRRASGPSRAGSAGARRARSARGGARRPGRPCRPPRTTC